MIEAVKLCNKPLCIIEHNGSAYIGDARGEVYEIALPFLTPKKLITASGPVSALCFLDNKLFYGTWDGILCQDTKDNNKQIQLGTAPIKCISAFRNWLFVSIGKQLFVLDENLTVIEKHNTSDKIFCMDAEIERLRFGLGMGILASYGTEYEGEYKSAHESTILSMRNGITGSCDCMVRNNNKILYKGDSWIRSVWDSNTFSCGRSVLENGKVIYFHDDEVMGIVRISNTIISIGLDYCYKVYCKGMFLNEAEEQELWGLLNS